MQQTSKLEDGRVDGLDGIVAEIKRLKTHTLTQGSRQIRQRVVCHHKFLEVGKLAHALGQNRDEIVRQIQSLQVRRRGDDLQRKGLQLHLVEQQRLAFEPLTHTPYASCTPS